MVGEGQRLGWGGLGKRKESKADEDMKEALGRVRKDTAV